MMNVKYLISPQRINHPDIKLIKAGQLRASQGNIPVEVYKLNDFFPRAWFVNDIQQLGPEGLFNEIIKPTFNPRERAFVNKIIDQPSDLEATINNIDIGLHKILLTTESAGNQFLVLSEVFYPLRWKAYVNGKETEILKVLSLIHI